MNELKTSQKGIELIKKFEGCKLTAYRDSVGVWTIGFGHTKDVKADMVITAEQAEQFLKDDMVHFEYGVNKLLKTLKTTVTQNQFDALISFAFNLGLGNLRKSTLAKKLYVMQQNDRDSVQDVADEFPRWNKAGGQVLTGLTKRRNAERALFLTP
ncbi:lysozyme [Actinobacillus porcinus]|uniref:lysozyme n=1 Tax=Actinobacillus porcinus TaxID=51048 RepID=UPI002A918EF1|nr:lysozyme [Actinobacillus porcinus]MDY6216670.1 lysozyme [Actinobacillus porcinus]